MTDPVTNPQRAIAHYTCYRTDEKITVDGVLDETCWKEAPKSPRFVDLVTGQPGFLDTKAAALWSEDCLYVAFWVQEPNVQAHLTERDSMICAENDVEVFLAGKNTYYEFEINALGTYMEIFYIWQDAYTADSPYARAAEFDLVSCSADVLGGMCDEQRAGSNPRGKRWAFRNWNFPGLRVATHIEGRLNDPYSVDIGWTVELAFPWEGMRWLADGRSLPPKDGDVWRLHLSRFEHIRPNGRSLGPPIGWAWNAHGAYNSHMPEYFTYVHFTETRVDSIVQKGG